MSQHVKRFTLPWPPSERVFSAGRTAGLLKAALGVHTRTSPTHSHGNLGDKFSRKALTPTSLCRILLWSVRFGRPSRRTMCRHVSASFRFLARCREDPRGRRLPEPCFTDACYLVQNRPFDIWTLFSPNTLKGGEMSRNSLFFEAKRN